MLHLPIHTFHVRLIKEKPSSEKNAFCSLASVIVLVRSQQEFFNAVTETGMQLQVGTYYIMCFT